ncbi:MAG: ABC transporter transmembrane domain-containing protein, partial [Dolichospermum sp.]
TAVSVEQQEIVAGGYDIPSIDGAAAVFFSDYYGESTKQYGGTYSVVVMNFVSNSLSFVQSNLIANFAQRLQLGLVLDFGRQILRLPLSYYEARRSGEIVSRLQDIEQINQLVAQLVV